MAEQRYCPKCRRTMADTNFYTYKNKEKAELCKACMTMHINNWEPDTFLWLLEKFDVPWIESEWNVLRDRAYQKDPYKMNGMSVFGKYISKMKLKQWKDYTWDDTEMLAEKARKEAEMYGTPTEQVQQKIDEMKQAYENGEITEAQYLTYAEINAPKASAEITNEEAYKAGGGQPQNAPFEQIELEDVSAQLTDEDKMNLAIKWGTLYRPNEWVALEKLYNDFMNSFDIQGAARLDTLKKICKTSLKMDQAIDCGDVESYQKLSRVYDALMKSAKFTEAQNKEEKGDFVDCLGQMVDYCEKVGGAIPRYEIKVPYDIIDKIIDDLKAYNKSLIYEDKSLAEEIEQYLKNKQSADEMKKDRAKAREQGLDHVELNDEDYTAFREAISADIEKDKELYIAGGDDE